MNDDLIYGKNKIQNIIGIETDNDKLYLYVAKGDKTEIIRLPNYHYVLMDKYDIGVNPGRLEGNNHYKYFAKFSNKADIYDFVRKMKNKGIDTWYPANPVESVMLKDGYTMYKGMKLDQISTLSFDIETTGVKINDNSFVTLISNTYRSRSGVITKRMFAFDDYDSPKLFLDDWCKWVRTVDPDVVLGHNVFNFDIPYLIKFAQICKTKLHLGRNASVITVDRYPRRFRKDGSQTYEYLNARIFGREIVDTFFLSLKADTARRYPSYGLKAIIAFEGLEKEGRQHWDFSKNKEPWTYPDQWVKFKQYAEDDADDALALFDLMAPQFFYYTQAIPKTFQQIINTATGSQVDYFMMRSYLQRSLAIPKASEKEPFEGAISIGNPGVYKDVFKVDVDSLYPSIMLEYNVYNPDKDPDRNFLAAVKFFTDARLENKRLAAETGDRFYNDMSNGQKIMINSFYGFMGAPGLRFNYPEGAAKVTRVGREILTCAIDWCSRKGFALVNGDTDSISFTDDGTGNMKQYLNEINALYPDLINWSDDGYYDSVIVVKAKNYLLKKGDEITIKGSALKATMKETALTSFLKESLTLLMDHRLNDLQDLYLDKVDEIKYLKDITPWCSKKTITEAVLTGTGTTETRIRAAIQGINVQEGDKIRVFFKSATEVSLQENFDGTFDSDRMYEKLYNTVAVFSPILEKEYGFDDKIVKKTGEVKKIPVWKSKFKNYKLKGNKVELESL